MGNLALELVCRGIAGKRYRLFANIKGQLKPDFLRRYPVDSNLLVAEVDPQSIEDYSASTETPITILVTQGGIARKVWSGALGDSSPMVDEIKKETGWRKLDC